VFEGQFFSAVPEVSLRGQHASTGHCRGWDEVTLTPVRGSACPKAYAGNALGSMQAPESGQRGQMRVN